MNAHPNEQFGGQITLRAPNFTLLMTYLILPTLTRRLATWIYPTQTKV